jgi:hypothetical protein
MNSITVIIPEGKMHKDWEWTLWAEDCKIASKYHYTFGMQDTLAHAKEHPHSAFNSAA